MFKKFTELWQGSGIMQRVLAELGLMIDDAGFVYTQAWTVCTTDATLDEVAGPLKDRDKAVNRREREIRRLLVEHLTLTPGRDVSGCLAIMSMAKDVERIGDLSKDVFDQLRRLEGSPKSLPTYDRLHVVQTRLAAQLPILREAIVTSSDPLAHKVLDGYNAIKPLSKSLLDEAYTTNLDAREAIVSAMLARLFLRINAHIGNAATAITFPLENIDFVNRGLKQERGEGSGKP